MIETASMDLGQQIVADILKSKEPRTKPIPCNSNWPSKIGHPCERYLVYLRTRWMDQERFEPKMILLFDLGDAFEKTAIKQLTGAGYECIREQEPFFLEDYQISGKVDWIIKLKDNQLGGGKGENRALLECKGMAPYAWSALNTIEDFFNSNRDYIRIYPAQLQLYMHALDIHVGLLFIVNKVTGYPKAIIVNYDQEYVDEILSKTKRVMEAIQNNILPERMEYDKVFCTGCSFKHICAPPQLTGEGSFPELDDEFYMRLKRREELAPAHSEYDSISKWVDANIFKGKNRFIAGTDGGIFNISWSQVVAKKSSITTREKGTISWRKQITRIGADNAKSVEE